MMNKKRKIAAGIFLCICAAAVLISFINRKKAPAEIRREVYPRRGVIKTFVSTTGTILPQNRLEIKPPINGRVETILVGEGDYVSAGQTLIWMSSTERAALIDAARAQGGAQLKYWEDVYKPIPLIAPIRGTVIVKAMEPGQTATTLTPILVLSDRLIVKANVDETDIGRVKDGQTAEIKLDAYPDVRVSGRVILIKYESTIINNVTTYEVHILPDKVPSVYKSGMSANILIFEKIKKDVLLLPTEAIINENKEAYVLVGRESDNNPAKRGVETGLNDDQETEIVHGLSEKDTVIIIEKKIVSTEAKKSSPFMPVRKK